MVEGVREESVLEASSEVLVLRVRECFAFDLGSLLGLGLGLGLAFSLDLVLSLGLTLSFSLSLSLSCW